MEVIVIILTLLYGSCESIPVRQPEVIVVKCPEGRHEFPPMLDHPTNCNQFFICNLLHPVLKTCPPGLVFDASVDVCNWPWAVDCSRKDQARENTVVIVDINGNINEGVTTDDTEDEAIIVGDADDQSKDKDQGPSSVIVDTDNNINKGVKMNDTEDEAIDVGDTVQLYQLQSEDELRGHSPVNVDTDGDINDGVKINDTEDEAINVGDAVQLYDHQSEDKVQGLSSVFVDTDNNINKGVKMNDTEDEAIDVGDTVQLHDLQSEDEVRGHSPVNVDTDGNINDGVKINDTEYEAINVGNSAQLNDNSDNLILPDVSEHQNDDKVQEPSSVIVDTDGNIIEGVKMNDKADEAINVGDSAQLYDTSDSVILRDVNEHQNEDKVQGSSSVIVDTGGNINEGVIMNDKADEAIKVGDSAQLYDTSDSVIRLDVSEHQNEDKVQGLSSVIEDILLLEVIEILRDVFELQSEDGVKGNTSVIVETNGNMNGGIKINDKEDEVANDGDYDNGSSDIEILRDISEYQSEKTSVIVETNDNINDGITMNDKEDEVANDGDYDNDSVYLYDSSDIEVLRDVNEYQSETTSVIVETNDNINDGIKIKGDEAENFGVYDNDNLRVQVTTSVIGLIVETKANMNGGIKINDKGDEAGHDDGDYDNDSLYVYDSSDIETLRDGSEYQSETTFVIMDTNDNIIKINDKEDEAGKVGAFYDNVELYKSDGEKLGSNIQHQNENLKYRGHKEYKITRRPVNSELLNEADDDKNKNSKSKEILSFSDWLKLKWFKERWINGLVYFKTR